MPLSQPSPTGGRFYTTAVFARNVVTWQSPSSCYDLWFFICEEQGAWMPPSQPYPTGGGRGYTTAVFARKVVTWQSPSSCYDLWFFICEEQGAWMPPSQPYPTGGGRGYTTAVFARNVVTWQSLSNLDFQIFFNYIKRCSIGNIKYLKVII